MADACLPTAQQELLLKACLGDEDVALASYRAWRAAVDIDDLDIGSIRVLPLLAERLRQFKIEDQDFGRYSGVQRRTWARNQMLLRGVERAAGVLARADIPAMALKGLALAWTYYPQTSLRPMGDLDLMVRLSDAQRANAALEAQGWPPAERAGPNTRAGFALRHARGYHDPSDAQVQLDLHWRMLYSRFSDEGEAALWASAKPLRIERLEIFAPGAADLLIHVCAHGIRWNPTPALRWVIDAAMILRSGEVDWAHLSAQTRRFGLGVPMLTTLRYLAGAMSLDVPQAVLAELASIAPTALERAIYRSEAAAPADRGLVTAFRLHHHIARQGLVRQEGMAGYWRYFAAVKGDRSMGEVAAWMRRRLRGQRS